MEVVERGDQPAHDEPAGGQVQGRREDVVGRLRGVDVVVGVDRPAEALRGHGSQDLVGVHVGAGAGARLEHVEREVIVEGAEGHLGRRVVDGRGDVLRDHAEAAVDRGRHPLDRAQGVDQFDGHRLAGDGEVLDRPLRLRAPQRRARDPDLAQRVVLDAMVAHDTKLKHPTGSKLPAGTPARPTDVVSTFEFRPPNTADEADTVTAMPEFEYQELLPTGHDDTPYRLLTTDGVSTFDTPEGRFVKVDPEALTLLTREAMRDIAHLLRPGHLQQLRSILDDPEASPNDRFVALDLLKNAGIAAGGVLPMCQDTGTAIVKGKRGQFVFTGGGDEAAIAAASTTRTSPPISATRRWRR